jgi:hypothetical protein
VQQHSVSATVLATCNYDDRLSIATQLVGGLKYNDGGWEYIDPAPYPFGFGDGVSALSVSIKPCGDRDDNGFYHTAELTISYGPYLFLPYDSDTPVTICSVTANCSAEQLPLPTGAYQWPDGTLINDDDFKPSLVFPTIELKVKVMYTAEPLISDCSDLLGKVNQDILYLPNPVSPNEDSFDPDTVLFVGVSPEMVVNSEGYLCYTRELTFQIRDNGGTGWNGLWNPADAQFESITSAPDPTTDEGGGDPPYEEGDFSTLFKIKS